LAQTPWKSTKAHPTKANDAGFGRSQIRNKDIGKEEKDNEKDKEKRQR
jgi:hypothetical protein